MLNRNDGQVHRDRTHGFAFTMSWYEESQDFFNRDSPRLEWIWIIFIDWATSSPASTMGILYAHLHQRLVLKVTPNLSGGGRLHGRLVWTFLENTAHGVGDSTF